MDACESAILVLGLGNERPGEARKRGPGADGSAARADARTARGHGNHSSNGCRTERRETARRRAVRAIAIRTAQLVAEGGTASDHWSCRRQRERPLLDSLPAAVQPGSD